MARPVALIILDGWGERAAENGNAVRLADTPIFDRLWRDFPHTFLQASGLAVGLPAGVMGNSEVGHLNIGAGRVVFQELTRINESIRAGEFARHPELRALGESVRNSGGTLHLLGLLSTGGVHSHLDHLLALLEATKAEGVARVRLHLFTDGRDTPPTSGIEAVRAVQTACTRLGHARIATLCGRYYAMDRDKRWERTRQAYAAIVHGEGARATDPEGAVQASYQAGVTDEFLLPVVLTEGGQPLGRPADGDAALFFNFRTDRGRQLTRALALTDFAEFERGPMMQWARYATMTQYHQDFPFPVLFAPQSMEGLFGEVIAAHGLKQLRIAETEKYAHVTFFFNGGEERLYPGEDRALIPSPRDVATYDLKPEMSAAEVTREVCERIASGQYDAIILNFANPDMVGHTGVIPAAIRAVETVDGCLGRVLDALWSAGGAALVTADHGNCEEMLLPDGSPHTAHTTNLVPCILADPGARTATLRSGGRLADLSPTLLAMLGIIQPAAMTGRSLIERVT